MALRKRKKGTHVDARELTVGQQQLQFNIALILQGISGLVFLFFFSEGSLKYEPYDPGFSSR